MPTERFSKLEFESALPVDTVTKLPLWTSVGLIDGEEVYQIKVTTNVYIEIRSSVGSNGFAKSDGEDSIRCSLLYKRVKGVIPLGKASRTNRIAGWEIRLKDKLRELYRDGFATRTCKICGSLLALRHGKNGDFYGCTNYPECKHTESVKEQTVQIENDDDFLDELENIADSAIAEEELDRTDLEIEQILDEQDELEELISKSHEPVKQVRLNEQQLAYVQAPINADIRVIAAPGSGKTTASVERIIYLIQNGINPNSIVYVTYTKAMATEGYERIVARMPEIKNTRLSTQICTIHAFCFRILRSEGDRRQKAKEWQVKQTIEALVSGDKYTTGEFVDYPEKPGYKDVLHWINLPKVLGVPESEISDFYRGRLNLPLALKTERIYFSFNSKMKRSGLITFADMLNDVEQRLLNDKQFRLRMQSKYTHILVDEAQDINQQALRILMTIAERG